MRLYAKENPLTPLALATYCMSMLYLDAGISSVIVDAVPAIGEMLEQGLQELITVHKGSVYLAANPVYPAQIYKIGYTRLAPQARMRSLGSAGVLGHFVLLKGWSSKLPVLTERKIHQTLQPYRAQGELYQAPYALLHEVIEAQLERESLLIHELFKIASGV